jgi:hypothetical protein
MNWEALGAIAETLGAIGVILTLLYLAVQIRANTRAVRASSFEEMARSIRELNLALTQDADLSRIWSSGLVDFDSLPREEKARLAMFLNLQLNAFQNTAYQIQQGTLDPALEETTRKQLAALCAAPGFATWWGRNKAYVYLPHFARLVDELVSKDDGPAA